MRDERKLTRTSAAAAADTGNLIDLRRFGRLWSEHWIGATLTAVILAAVTAFVLLRKPAVYASSATLLVERSNDRVVDIKQVVDDTVDSSLADAAMLTHIQQIQSHTFLLQVMASLTPAQRTRFLAPYRDFVPGRIAPLDGSPAQTEEFEKLLVKNLTVERRGRTLLITLTVRHRDPASAQLLANRMAEQYIVYLINRSGASNDSALTFLNSQARELKVRLEDAERQLQTYREENNLVLLDHDQSILSDRLKSMSQAATQAKLNRMMIEARLGQVQSVLKGNDDGARQLAATPEFAGLADVQKQIDELQARRSVMADRYGKEHPLMVENAASIAALQKLRKEQVEGALAEFQAQRDKAVADEKRVGDELASAEKESLRLDKLAVKDNELHRGVETVRESYSQILARLNQTTISSRLQNTNIKFVDRAGLSDSPVEPNRIRVVFLALLIGGIVFVAFPWAADALDQRVRAWAEIEDDVQVPLLAEVPTVAALAPDQRAWVVARDLEDQAAEAFRSLHSQLQILSKHAGRKTVLITSTIPAEGKSFISCNLAASFAAHGRRTLLIDADFRRPSLHTAFGMDNKRGILKWERPPAAAASPAAVSTDPQLDIVELAPNLSLLRSGGVSRKMTEMMQGGAMDQLLAALQTEFDVIVIDAPPAGLFPDAEVLARLADEVVYVARFKGANRTNLRQVLQRLHKGGVNLAGVVVNALPVNRFGPSYFSSQGYSAVKYGKYYAKQA
jgi:succinoglycan biosynthesis transport protein ExoP